MKMKNRCDKLDGYVLGVLYLSQLKVFVNF